MSGAAMLRAATWLCRVLTGATFVVSGWAKCIDPAGFVYKIEEYLAAWGISAAIPPDIVIVFAVGLSLFELVTGVLLATGCMRRAAPICGLLLMAVMLPLSIYIYVAEPVADCGCFGDFIILSNGATMWKNVVITLMLGWAQYGSKHIVPLYRPSTQWLAIAISAAYGLTLAFIGWNIQPMVDFRPYPVGTALNGEAVEEATPTFIYSKDGEEREFALDALPDSTWTFVSAVESEGDESALAIFDDDYEVTDEILSDLEGDVLLLVVNNPDIEYITRARLANEINDSITARGGRMIGLVAASGEALEQWTDLARPHFEVYSCGDTGLKQLVRGNASIVALRDGVIMWKRSLVSIDPAMLRDSAFVDDMPVIDDGSDARNLTLLWILLMIIFPTADRGIRRLFRKKPKSND